jgi:DNA helicase INO80
MKVSLNDDSASTSLTNTDTGEGHFDESAKASGAATPVSNIEGPPGAPGGKKGKKGLSKKAKTAKQRLAVADGEV